MVWTLLILTVQLSRIRVCIIDEITMISSACLDAIDHGLSRLMSQVARPHHQLPFGGVSMILFGDLAQVPAVVPNCDDYNQYLHQFLRTTHYDRFLFFVLRKQMRQCEDELEFIRVLDACREARQGYTSCPHMYI